MPFSSIRALFGKTGRFSHGLTLVELIATVAIVSILALGALPLTKVVIQRQKEVELRRALRNMRTAIDRYHDRLAGQIELKFGTDGWPPDLDTLVEGVEQLNAIDKRLRSCAVFPSIP